MYEEEFSETSRNFESVSAHGIYPMMAEHIDMIDLSKNSKENDKGTSLFLKNHCFVDGSSGFIQFQAETLPMISNEYHHTDVDVLSESSFEKIPDGEIVSGTQSTDVEIVSDSQNTDGKIVSDLQNTDVEIESDLHEKCTVDANASKVLVIRDFEVRCLQTYEDLMQTCQNLGLKFTDCAESKLYEVDLILDDKIEEGMKYYYVKWKNYDLKTNTWEPDYHLLGCQESIKYHEYLKSDTGHLRKDMVDHFVRELITRRPFDILVLCRLCSLVFDLSEDYYKTLTLTKLKLKAREILFVPFSKFANLKYELLNLMRFSQARKKILISLKEWESEINAFNPATYIEVENDVDLEEPPKDFTFIHDYISDEVLGLNAEAVTFCNCDNCYENKNGCCPHDSDGPFPYNKFGRLQLLPGYPVYECNKKCQCGQDCVNRVVQHGQKVKVAIFRTSNGCGWGLKTLETIQKDQFVLEYLGEILTSEAAESRGKLYDYVGRSYLFDLDYGEENCQYTVDARHVGNASHFINHSCNPNLHVFAVWIDQQDPLLPRLAFFAKKKINRGEELTFDYKMVKHSEKFDIHTSLSTGGRMECKCNSKKCRKYLF